MRPTILALLLVSCRGGEPAASPSPSASGSSDSTSESASASGPASGAGSASGPASASAAAKPETGVAPAGGVVSLGQVIAPKNFDPNAVLVSLKPKMLECFNKARGSNPQLHGKLKLKVVVRETGAVNGVDGDPGDPAFDPALLVCLGDAFKAAQFPSPGGTASMTVPLIFRQ